MSVKVEVSLGEALDKLSILDIKKNKIIDTRRNDVIVEFNYLYHELEEYIKKYNYLYSILYRTNLRIWDCMDIIRESKMNISDLYEYIDETIVLNDSRYVIKKKINEICNSKLKEQKGYSLHILNIVLNCNDEMLSNLNGAIRYYSFFYDELHIHSTNEHISTLCRMFNDDPFIKIYDTNSGVVNMLPDIDYVKITNNVVDVSLSQSFLKKNDNMNNSKYSDEANELYNKLGLSITICNDYKNEC